MPGKTFIACRPGMQQQMKSAFAGLDVVVDDKLTVDYEFRERNMTLEEIMEEETLKAEQIDLDPRNAVTLVVPLHPKGVVEDAAWMKWAVVRASNKHHRSDVEAAINEAELVIRYADPEVTLGVDYDDVDVPATLSNIKAALKKAGIEVHSVSAAESLSWPKMA